MLILVNGLLTYNSGKTLFARALVRAMVHQGLHPGVFKPQSAHNYWDHLSHTRTCWELRKLVSRDALELQAAAGDPTPIEVINPHHQVFAPLDVLRVWEARPGAASSGEDELLAERMTFPDGPTSTLFVHRDAKLSIAEEGFLEAISHGAIRKPLDPLAAVERGRMAHDAIAQCLAVQARTHRDLLVESTNDVALPPALEPKDVTLVVTLAANLVLAFDGRDFFRGLELRKMLRVRDFLALAEPILGYRLPYVAEADKADADRLYAHYGTAAVGILDAAAAKARDHGP